MLVRRLNPLWSSRQRRPLGELQRMQHDMLRLFDELAGDYPGHVGTGVFPPLNVSQDDHHYYLRAELPGVTSDDLDVSVVGRTVSIAGRRGDEAAEGVSYHRRERSTGAFSRSITLPGEVDAERVQAKHVNGLLTVQLEKPQRAKPRQIKVASA